MTRAAGRSLLGISTPLATTYDVALLDLDGVVYVGPDSIPTAAPALARARAAGMRLAFVTNNASRDPAAVAAHLLELGVPAVAGEVVTSSQAAATVLIERLGAGASVLVTGSAALRSAVAGVGLRIVSSSDDRPDAVVQGYSPDLRYADLAEAALAVRAGALWVATNTDSTLPSARGLLPGNGSLVAMVAVATGRRPVVAGKPQLPMHAEGVRRTGAKNPLVVGDRLDTDIEGANVADTDSLLVLTGVTAATDLVDAPVEHRPTYLAADLTGLLDTQPEVEHDGGATRCGGWTASAGLLDGSAGSGGSSATGGSGGSGGSDGRVTISIEGAGRPIDGLRAVLTAAWTARDAGASSVDAADSLRKLEFS